MKNIIILFFVSLLIYSGTFAYNPTDKDDVLLTNLYKKIDPIIEKAPNKIGALNKKISELKEKFKNNDRIYYIFSELENHINNVLNPIEIETKVEAKSEIGSVNNMDIIIKTKCTNDWPTDFSMRKYCQDKQYDGIKKLNLGKPNDIDKNNFDTIRNKCSNDWPTDFSMRAYCEDKQFVGIRKLILGKADNITESEFTIIRNKCTNDWLTDFSMRVYCEDKQFIGIRELAQGKPSDITENNFIIIRNKCTNDWPTDFSMRAYCEDKQFIGIRELK